MYLSSRENPNTIHNKKYNYSYYHDRLSPQFLEFLKQLKPNNIVKMDGLIFLICHGSPWDRDQYVYSDTDLEGIG